MQRYDALEREYQQALEEYEQWNESDRRTSYDVGVTLMQHRAHHQDNNIAIPDDEPRTISTKQRIELDLMHSRLAHRSSHSILLSNANNLYKDARIIPTNDEFCEICQVSKIKAANKGPPKVRDVKVFPGQVFYLDVQPNPIHGGLTASTSFNNYLSICDEAS